VDDFGTKYIFVTGGVVSSIGKGTSAAALAMLLKSRGYRVALQKFDPSSTRTWAGSRT